MGELLKHFLTRRNLEMKNNTGVTLLELIIVVSIIGILVVVLGFSYQGWTANYKVESQTKELYADLMHARLRAIHRNRKHFVKLENTRYTIYEDTNEDGDADTSEILPAYPKNLDCSITWNGSGNKTTFDTGGLLTSLRTIHVTSNIEADYNCIVLSRSRINIGKWDGASCDAK